MDIYAQKKSSSGGGGGGRRRSGGGGGYFGGGGSGSGGGGGMPITEEEFNSALNKGKTKYGPKTTGVGAVKTIAKVALNKTKKKS